MASRQKRYRTKRVVKGMCPHCGKPCEPYFECEERREYKRALRNKGIYKRAKYDYRRWPRDRRTGPGL